MRVIGMRKLREALDVTSGTAQADSAARLDALRYEIVGRLDAMAERDLALDRRLDALDWSVADVRGALDELRSEEGGRARSAFERGEALDNDIRDLRGVLDELRSEEGERARSTNERGDALDNSIRDLNAGMSRLLTTGRSEEFLRALGDLRVEMSSMRADFVSEIGMMSDHLERLLGDVRIEVLSE